MKLQQQANPIPRDCHRLPQPEKEPLRTSDVEEQKSGRDKLTSLEFN